MTDTPKGQVPEALARAAELESIYVSEIVTATKAREIAAELRRLHAQVVALSAQPAATPSGGALPDPGPWQVDHWPRRGAIVLQSHHFEHDAALMVTGDFASNDAKRTYAENLCKWMNDAIRASHGQAPAGAALPEVRVPQIAECGETLSGDYADWPAWCNTFALRLAYQHGIADARAQAAQQAPAGATDGYWMGEKLGLYSAPVAQQVEVGDAVLEAAAQLLESQHTWITNVAAANLVRSLAARAAQKEGGA